MRNARSLILAAGLTLAAAGAAAQSASDWQPAQWKDEDTLELGTTAPGEEIHWFPVWLVVIDGELYVRLGNRAAGRVEGNTTKPILGVRVGGKQFDRVTGTPAPDKAEAVAKAMSDKYWSDVAVRFFSHPLTLRLDPAQ